MAEKSVIIRVSFEAIDSDLVKKLISAVKCSGNPEETIPELPGVMLKDVFPYASGQQRLIRRISDKAVVKAVAEPKDLILLIEE
jgi:hypothetical protein